jgi:DNA-binding response OmpR family regulator
VGRAEGRRAASSPGASPRILVAEDDEDLLRFIRLTLTRVGYEVLEARDGRQALELALASPPDLAVLDVMMPGVDGCEVTRRLRAEPATRHMPVILLSARAQGEDVARGIAAGANDYVTKPVTIEALRERVKAALQHGPTG